MKNVRHLRFEALPVAITLVDCQSLFESLPIVFPGWQYGEISDPGANLTIRLRCEDSTFRMEADWLEQPIRHADLVDAICALVAEMVGALVRHDSKILCLHGASAEFGGRLVVFPNRYRSGKSLLAACLSAAGIRIFGDDVLPLGLAHGQGIAAGIAPRLRMPLPANLEAENRAYIDARIGVAGKRYLYLDLDDGALARRSESLPIGAFVLLEREQRETEASIEEIDESDVLRQVVWQNFARKAQAPRILERLGGLVLGARRFRLRYHRVEDAVSLLKRSFTDWPRFENPTTPPLLVSSERRDVVAPDAGQRYLRKPGIEMLTVDGEFFLADAEGAAIHHLNRLGSAIWSLLGDPVSLEETLAIVEAAFPEQDSRRIADDVGALLDELLAKNLVTKIR